MKRVTNYETDDENAICNNSEPGSRIRAQRVADKFEDEVGDACLVLGSIPGLLQ